MDNQELESEVHELAAAGNKVSSAADQMSCTNCGQMFCVCPPKVETAPQVRSTHQPLPHGITKDEFNPALYDTIKQIESINKLRAYRETTRPWQRKPGDVLTWQQKETGLLEQVSKQMQLLNDADAGEIARRYPWVARL